MRNRTQGAGAIGVALASLVVPWTPASAVVGGSAAFTVNVQTPAWGYSVIYPPTSGLFTCGTLIGGKNTIAGTCSFTGSGQAVGGCGLASGNLWGTLQWAELQTGVGGSVWFHINFQITGTTFLAAGTAGSGSQTGAMTVELDFTPVFNPGGPSCANGTLTDFVATGNANFAVV